MNGNFAELQQFNGTLTTSRKQERQVQFKNNDLLFIAYDT